MYFGITIERQPIEDRFILSIRRCFKHFSEQAFLQDLAEVKWHFIALIPSVDVAVQFVIDHFLSIINRHAPLRKFRVKNRNTPWFTRELSDLIHDRNKQWSLARKSNTSHDWLLFRVLRNKCSALY